MLTRSILGTLLAGALGACASTGGGSAAQAPAPTPQPSTIPSGLPSSRPDAQWPIRTREHVDLWLHGFALLQPDTTLVPFFRRGYADSMRAVKARTNVVTVLDANKDRLAARFLAFPNLVSAQFVALNFANWTDLQHAVDVFLRADGDVSKVPDTMGRTIVLSMNGYFPTAPDREWLRLFVQGLEEERTKYYDSYWLEQQRARAGTIASLDTAWQITYRPKLQRFLNNTRQATGDFLLSLPLDGEGRTSQVGRAFTVTAVASAANASERFDPIYTFVHEIVGTVANQAIEDNTTPAEKRSGTQSRYASNALVRAGAMLLQRVAPDLVDGYARYYLRSAKATVGADPVAQLATVFVLPDVLRDSIGRQLDTVLGGI